MIVSVSLKLVSVGSVHESWSLSPSHTILLSPFSPNLLLEQVATCTHPHGRRISHRRSSNLVDRTGPIFARLWEWRR